MCVSVAKGLGNTVEDVLEDDPPLKKRKLGLDFDESDEEEDTFDAVKMEIDSYRHEAMLSQEDDPLEWWRKRKSKYPRLI